MFLDRKYSSYCETDFSLCSQKGERATLQLDTDEQACKAQLTKVLNTLKTIYIFNFVFVPSVYFVSKFIPLQSLIIAFKYLTKKYLRGGIYSFCILRFFYQIFRQIFHVNLKQNSLF